MLMNIKLKLELIRRFGTQVEAARQLGIRENRLSYFVRQHAEPSEREREAFERVVGERISNRFFRRRGKSASLPKIEQAEKVAAAV
jgi:hypothetical protein